MKIAVMKFGGTSVADQDRRKVVYERIVRAKEEGFSPVVVISAMGRRGAPYATDTLLDLVKVDNPLASKRELDSIFVCGEIISGSIVAANLQKLGYKAVFLTGWQAGIITNMRHGDSSIIRVNTDTINEYLTDDYIVVVAGGQGISEKGNFTTLGRGGSDTTASSLGVALDADCIDIFTDVEGIMTADPRKVKQAEILSAITYDEACEMAYSGAKVIHPRAVEIAKQRDIPLRVRSTFSNFSGTLITNQDKGANFGCDYTERDRPVGIAHIDNLLVLKMRDEDFFMLGSEIKAYMLGAEEAPVISNGLYFQAFKSEEFLPVLSLLREEKATFETLEHCIKISVITSNHNKVSFNSKVLDYLKTQGYNIVFSNSERLSIRYVLENHTGQNIVEELYNLLFTPNVVENNEKKAVGS